MLHDTFLPDTFLPDTSGPRTLFPGTLSPETSSPATLSPVTLSPVTLSPDTLSSETLDSDSQADSESEYPFLYQPNCDWDGKGEDIDRYCTGGLHPVHLNDFFSTSLSGCGYRILHKLGHGSFSHVWYGQNLNKAHPGYRGAALKFIASDQTGKTFEVEINNFLASRSREEPGFHNVALCLETFQVNGPNGFHDVIASEPAIRISSLFYNSAIEHLDDRTIFQQTLAGVGFLHKHGVVHRDLHLGNIAIEFPILRTAGAAEIMKGTGVPACHAILPTAPTTHPPSLPTYGVESAKFCRNLLPLMIEEAHSFVVKIIDFGCSFRPATHDPPDAIHGFPLHKPPECNLSTMIPGRRHFSTVKDVRGLRSYGGPCSELGESPVALESPDLSDLVWSAQGDLWVLGCTLFSVMDRDQAHIFRGASAGGEAFFRTVARYLGPLPERYRLLLEETANLDSSWTSQRCARALDIDSSLSDPVVIEGNWAKLEQDTLRRRASWRMRWNPVVMDELEDMKRVQACIQVLRRMLRWSPGDRISAMDAAESLRAVCSI